jgi:predicted nucleic-acid-binding protein
MRTALDTNLLLRLLVQDDPAQAAAAEALIRRQAGEFFIGDIVLVETVWTLQRIRRFGREDVALLLRTLLEREDLVFEDADRVFAAVRALETGGDFADELIVQTARSHRCSHLATFDTELAARHPGFALRPR